MLTRLAAAVAALVCATTSPLPVSAQEWPQRPIRIIVAFGPGGGTDIIARIVGQALQDRLGQTVSVENRTGAGGIIGHDMVARADKDGHTLGVVVAGLVITAAMRKSMRYDTVADFDPIALVARQTMMIAVRPDFPANSVAELVKAAQAEPGKLTFASPAFGALQHFAGELFAQGAKVKLLHVPFKSSPEAITSLLSNNVNIIFDTVAALQGHIQSKDLKAIAVTGKARLPALPDVPTVIETGLVPDYEVATWYGLVGPRGLPAPVVAKLSKTTLEALADKAVAERLTKAGVEVDPGAPDVLGRLVAAEMKRWNDVRVAAGIAQVD